MADVDPTPNTYDVGYIIGPIIIGQVTTIFLYGILLNIFTHFLGSKAWTRASWSLRCTILVVFAVCTASIGLAMNDIWHFSTQITGSLDVYLAGTVPQAVEPALTGVIGLVVQIVLVVRVCKIITNRFLRAAFIFCVVGAGILGLYGAAGVAAWGVYYVPNPSVDVSDKFGFDWLGLFKIWLWTTASVNILITLVYIFAIHQRFSGGKRTTVSVLRLIVLGANRSAAYTSFFALVAAAIITGFGIDNISTYLISYAFLEPLPVLYALSLFTTLNVGDSLHERLSNPDLRVIRSGGKTPSQLPDFVLSSSAGDGEGRRSSDLSGRSGPLLGERRATGGSDDAYDEAENGLNVTKSGRALTPRASFTNDGRRSLDGRGIMVQVEKEEKVEKEEVDMPRERVLLI
ncbi:hypothetical protein JCM6882_003185 [Rhodosporidiobolus microsporus]